MQTIMITGCSSGFGLATAQLFLQRGWHVIGTVRQLDPAALPLPAHPQLRLLTLDVTDAASIAAAVQAAGAVDVLVNNAGIGALGAVEAMSMELVHALFATNTFGTMAVTRAMLPAMRARQSGVIINVSSSVTLAALPLLAVYAASKAAVNAYTTSLALELAPFQVRAHLVLPGRAPGTRFGANAQARMAGTIPAAYEAFAAKVFAGWGDADAPVTTAADVAAAVWRAATDAATPLRLPAGADAELLAAGQV